MQAKGTSYALGGALIGSVVGLMDAWLGQSAIPGILGPDSLVPLLVYSAALTTLPGAAAGICVFLFAQVLPLELLGIYIKKPWFIGILLAVSAITIWLGTVLLKARGIQIEAINYRPLLLTGFGLVIISQIARYLSPGGRKPLFAAIAWCTLALAIVSLGTQRLGNSPGVIETIETRTSLPRFVFSKFRSFSDKDGDGFPGNVCENDCDCNDENPSINPAALEIPGNNIDEDCSGSDLTLPAKATPVPLQTPPSYELQTPKNIILITVDAMRADHLQSYGYSRLTTPNIDRLASENVIFTQVRSQGPSTRHAFPPLLTGRYFSNLALKKGKKWSKLLASNETFAERLKDKNYYTAAVLPYFRFKEHSGFSQGFDSWQTVIDPQRNPVWDPTGDLVTDRGLAHLKELKDSEKPWFIWLHYFDPHASYVAHPDQESFGTEKADLYDGELLFVDSQIQRLIDGAQKLGMWEETAVILTSDHGEGLGLPGDHGQSYHGFTLFDTEIRVPLVVKLPGSKPSTVKESVALLDVTPTIIELAGALPSTDLDGKSLVPYLFGASQKRQPFITELPGDHPQVAIIDWPFKLIRHIRTKRCELYNLADDPKETTDLSEQNQAQVSQLKDQLTLIRQQRL